MAGLAMVTTEFSQQSPTEFESLSLLDDINLLLEGLHAWLLKRIGFNSITVNWKVETLSSLHNLPPKLVQSLANIFMEACKNCLHHSRATQLDIESIELCLNNRRGLAISITDNGCGYSVNSVRNGQGLLKIYNNASLLKAEVVIVSDSLGTQIKLWIPAIK